ncbi:hypothetical protein [Arthrobacter sp. NPDC090010]|uniref:hypothetical protein n=1 Tax=Arthrobacter sp. NPDC090010 TaxID=3363942 RepID=UPI003827DAF8
MTVEMNLNWDENSLNNFIAEMQRKIQEIVESVEVSPGDSVEDITQNLMQRFTAAGLQADPTSVKEYAQKAWAEAHKKD